MGLILIAIFVWYYILYFWFMTSQKERRVEFTYVSGSTV